MGHPNRHRSSSHHIVEGDINAYAAERKWQISGGRLQFRGTDSENEEQGVSIWNSLVMTSYHFQCTGAECAVGQHGDHLRQRDGADCVVFPVDKSSLGEDF